MSKTIKQKGNMKYTKSIDNVLKFTALDFLTEKNTGQYKMSTCDTAYLNTTSIFTGFPVLEHVNTAVHLFHIASKLFSFMMSEIQMSTYELIVTFI